MSLLDFLKLKRQRSSVFSGGNGESAEKAVIINLKSPLARWAAEYQYVQQICGRKDVEWKLDNEMGNRDATQ